MSIIKLKKALADGTTSILVTARPGEVARLARIADRRDEKFVGLVQTFLRERDKERRVQVEVANIGLVEAVL